MAVNVSRVVHSTRLGCRTIDVYRSKGEWIDGEFKMSDSEHIQVRGILTIAREKDIQQVPEGDRLVGAITLLTTVPMYQTGAANYSDVVHWAGANFKVLNVTPDFLYGFFRSVLQRMEGDGLG